MKIRLIPLLMTAVILTCLSQEADAQKRSKEVGTGYDVAAYLYPAYATGDPRLRPFWPDGRGEWETVYTMQKRHPGHYWDRQPLWGYINEADPAVMSMEIDQAVSHGVNVFIFDWYWFDGRPFMETTLTDGFLKAPNRDKMKFYLMWANHDVPNVWDTRLQNVKEYNVIWSGRIDRDEFEKVCRRNIEMFFKQPNYYKIDGKPVFMIYALNYFIDGLGGYEQAADAIAWFRNEVRKAGFPDLDLQFAMIPATLYFGALDDDKAEKSRNELLKELGINSTTHYQFCDFLNMDDEYRNVVDKAVEEWSALESEFDFPYYPHVTIGWDNTPRTNNSVRVRNNTPEEFARALQAAKEYVDARPELHPLVTINSWNEWTETSYLMPDNVYGYGYLDAVRQVFPPDAE